MRVLVAYDGSEGSSRAVTLVEAIEWPADSAIRVVTVTEPVVLPLPGAWGTGAAMPTPDVEGAITEEIRGRNAEAVRRLEQRGASVEGAVLRGRAATEIMEDARAFGADVVVMGSRGHGQIAALLLGSVSAEVADHCPCPVLVARTASLTQVVLATDGSPSAATAETLLADWPIFAELPIRAVSVAAVVRPWTTGIAPTMYREALDAYAADLHESKEAHQRIADDAAHRLRAAGRHAEAAMRVGDPAAEILAVAEEARADLVVLGSRGRSGITRALLGSVARNVLSGGTASVLIVRDQDDEEAGRQRQGAAPGPG